MASTALDYLATLKPQGVWKPPLSEEQIAEALAFGQRFYSDATAMTSDLCPDPYGLWLPEVEAHVTLCTAFNRLAAYAGQRAGNGPPPSPAEAERSVLSSSFQTGFMMRVFSKHKNVRVLHASGSVRQEMTDIDRSRDTLEREMGTFPYPADLLAVQYFEMVIPKLLFGKKVNFTFDFGALH